MRFPCECLPPRPYPAPHKRHTCVRCLGEIRREWTSNDTNLSAFFDRLAEAAPDFPLWMERVREQCIARERAGRDRFGFEYLTRDNATEATEEAADGLLYMYLDALKARRDGEDDHSDVALTAAYHFAQAHRYSQMLREKRRGNTGPAWDEHETSATPA